MGGQPRHQRPGFVGEEGPLRHPGHRRQAAQPEAGQLEGMLGDPEYRPEDGIFQSVPPAHQSADQVPVGASIGKEALAGDLQRVMEGYSPAPVEGMGEGDLRTSPPQPVIRQR